MKLNLIFNIGDDYELWEKDLECLPDRVKGCDSYLYLGNRFNKFLNYNTDKTELIFSWDVLKGIIVFIVLQDVSDSEVINNYLIGPLGHFESISINKCIIYKFSIYREELWSCVINKTFYIIKADKRIILSLFYSLL